MDKVRVYCDAFAKTLTVWLADPSIGRVYEEADDNTVFTKDVRGVDAILQKAEISRLTTRRKPIGRVGMATRT